MTVFSNSILKSPDNLGPVYCSAYDICMDHPEVYELFMQVTVMWMITKSVLIQVYPFYFFDII